MGDLWTHGTLEEADKRGITWEKLMGRQKIKRQEEKKIK